MASLAETHVALDESKTTLPNEKNALEYSKAFEEYKILVNQLSPLYK